MFYNVRLASVELRVNVLGDFENFGISENFYHTAKKVAKFKDVIVDQLAQSPADELENTLPEGVDLNFHFYHFMSKNEQAKQHVEKFSRDAPLHMAVRSESAQLVSVLGLTKHFIQISTMFSTRIAKQKYSTGDVPLLADFLQSFCLFQYLAKLRLNYII